MESSNMLTLPAMVAEIQLAYRTHVKPSQRPVVSDAKSAFGLFLSSWDMDRIELQEAFRVMLLNRNNRVLGIIDHCLGTTTGTLYDIRLIFAAALKANACAMIVAHNHPSGNPSPSRADINATKKLVQAGEIMDVKVLDHLVITPDTFYSFGDNGLL